MNSPTFTIDPKFQKLIDPLTPEEYAQLETNCLQDGILDPIKIWKQGGVILDGHNRYAIATEHGLPFNVVEMFMATREEAENWIDENQLGRRNLAPDKMALIRGRIYNRSKKAHGGQKPGGKPQSGESLSTAETLAPKLGVSEKTLKRDGAFAEAVEKLELAGEVASGKVEASRAEIVQAAKDLPAKPTPKQKAKAREKLEEPKAPKTPSTKAAPLAPEGTLEAARIAQLERLLPEKEEEAKALRVEITNLKVDKTVMEAKIAEMHRQLEESGAQVQELNDENLSMHRILDAEDLLAAFQKEVIRAQALARNTEERFRGIQNQNKALSKSATSWKRKFEALERKTKGTPEPAPEMELESDESPYPPVEV